MTRRKKNMKLRKSKSPSQRVSKVKYVPAKFSQNPREKDVVLKRQSSILLHWSVLLFLILMSFFAAFSLFPFLLLADIVAVSLFVVLFGLFYGYIFYLLIEHLEPVWYHHKLFAMLFIPLISLMGIFVISTIARQFSFILSLNTVISPLYVSVLYLFSFITPYILSSIIRFVKKE